MTDQVAKLTFSQTVRNACDKARKKQKEVHRQKVMEDQEEIRAEAKREQDRLERERVLRMTPEQQAKYREKKQKKEQTRMKSKYMKVMK